MNQHNIRNLNNLATKLEEYKPYKKFKVTDIPKILDYNSSSPTLLLRILSIHFGLKEDLEDEKGFISEFMYGYKWQDIEHEDTHYAAANRIRIVTSKLFT